MLFAFDIGNTNITLGGFNEDELIFTARLSSDAGRTADQYAADIAGILALKGFSPSNEDECIICSVVPTLSVSVSRAVIMLTGKKPLVLGPGVKTGLNIKIDNPAQLGADLAAGAVGTIEKYPLPALVIDLGTASTLSVINGKGEFLGGAIAAGIKSTLSALTENTALLSEIGVEKPKKVIGSNTADCMKSGLIIGAAAMIDGFVTRMENELGEEFKTIVATGGLAGEVIPCCERKILIDDNLLLDGLKAIYNKNK